MSVLQRPKPGSRLWGAATLASTLLLLGFAATASADRVGIKVNNVLNPALSSYEVHERVSGRMTIAGSDTMQPLLAKLAMEFRRRHPDIKIAIQGSRNHGESTALPLAQAFIDGFANSRRGDGKTSGHFGSNDIQLLASSRPLTEKEVQQFQARHGYEPTAIPIAQDAVALYANRSNPVEGLTLQQVDAIFSETRKRGLAPIRTWGQLGLSDEWEKAPIHLYGRDKRSSGTLPFFKHLVLLDGEFKKDLTELPGSASIALAVSNDPFGIGYSSIGFQTSSIRPIPLAAEPGQPLIAPTEETVMNGSYPLSRPLYLYVNKDPREAVDEKIFEFLRFVNSREGQYLVVQGGMYPLTAEQVSQNLYGLGIPPVQSASVGGRGGRRD